MLKIICFDAFHNKKHFESELLPYSHTPPLVSMKVKDYRKHPLLVNIKKKKKKHRGLQLSGLGRLCLAYMPWVRTFACTSVTPAVPYMSIGFAGCLVDPRISHDAHKLAQKPWVIKKTKNKL